jgi:hypothetical protein
VTTAERLLPVLSLLGLPIWWPYFLVIYVLALLVIVIRTRDADNPPWVCGALPLLASSQLLITLSLFCTGFIRDYIWLTVHGAGGHGPVIPASISQGARSLPVSFGGYVALLVLYAWVVRRGKPGIISAA